MPTRLMFCTRHTLIASEGFNSLFFFLFSLSLFLILTYFYLLYGVVVTSNDSDTKNHAHSVGLL